MGNHRANIKIEMRFHGVEDKTDMWLNYCPNDCCDMDERVLEFFQDVYKRGMVKYDEAIEKMYAKENKA